MVFMKPDKKVLAAFDRERELARLRTERKTEEFQAWYKERELLLEDLKKEVKIYIVHLPKARKLICIHRIDKYGPYGGTRRY